MGDEKRSFPEIRIRGVSAILIIELENIAKNKGYSTLNEFMKIELRKIRDNVPERFRKDHNL